MRWRLALLVAFIGLMVGMLGLQFWLMAEQDRLRDDRQARHDADMAAWQAQPQAPGRPLVPPPPTYYEPPAPPPVLVLNGFFPILMALAAAYEIKKRKARDAEEEARTTYTEEDLMGDWEFKIVRSPVGLFDRPAFLARILDEEAAGGWRLVEKFDKHRVRLKRAGGSAAGPPGYDPFRTAVGPQTCIHPVLWVLCGFCVLFAIGMALVSFADSTAARPAGITGAVAVVLALGLARLAGRQRAKYRRLAG